MKTHPIIHSSNYIEARQINPRIFGVRFSNTSPYFQSLPPTFDLEYDGKFILVSPVFSTYLSDSVGYYCEVVNVKS